MERTRAGAGDAARKRKRGALQDISNNTKNVTRPRASTRKGAVVVKKKVAAADKPAKSKVTCTKSTATTVNSALRSMASTAASKAKNRIPAGKKAESSRTKRRKLESADEQPSAPQQKVQTSMLSFQTQIDHQEPDKGKHKADKENIEVITEISTEVKTDQVKQTKLEEIKSRKNEDSVIVQDVPQIQKPKQETAVEATRRDDYAPRPFTFTFDHTSSCFDKATYSASVRNIDKTKASISSPHAKLVRELDSFYKKHELKYLPDADYIGTVQLDINEKMRTILVDWLVEVAEEYELDSQTFHKAVNLVDRCLKKIKINRKQFQLLGCACMMIAAKFEEVYGPNVEEFVYISDQTYTSDEMLEMEAKVLKALEYRVASTTCYGFMHRYKNAGCTTDKQRSLVSYLCDFALLYYQMVKFKPSILVASAVYLTRLTTGEIEPWTPTLHHVSKYNPLDFQKCVEELHRLHATESQVVQTQRDKAKAVSEKYLVDKFHNVSTIPACSKSQVAESFGRYTPS